MNHFLTRLMELGTLNNLLFSSQEVMQYAALGLDDEHHTLLILTRDNESTDFDQLVDLTDVKTCYVKKQYGTIMAGNKKNKLDEYVEKISLCFELKWSEHPVEVVFYNRFKNRIKQIRELEQKARHWKAILSKLRKSPLKEAA